MRARTRASVHMRILGIIYSMLTVMDRARLVKGQLRLQRCAKLRRQR